MVAWLTGLIPRKVLVWGAVAVGVVAAIGVYLWRRDARVARETMARVTAATDRQELEDRRVVDDVEAEVAGLDDRERRERLRQWRRNQNGGV